MGITNHDKIRMSEKVYAGMPYLYRAKGLPSEVFEVRFKQAIDETILNLAIADTLERLPYFGVKYEEKEGDFYSVRNERPLKAHHSETLISLGGKANNEHMMGVNFMGNILKISFHHGLTDGKGAKRFLETLVHYYVDYDQEVQNAEGKSLERRMAKMTERHHVMSNDLSESEYFDPCETKYRLGRTHHKIEGLNNKGFKLPETVNKKGHRRYDLRFSQETFMASCRKYGASPIILLSMMMSRGIQKAYPDNQKAIVSHFPMDARHILGCDDTFKNCVKSMSLPYGETEQNMSMETLSAHYKTFLNAQKNRDYCAKEFNNIVMLLSVIGLFKSYASRQKLLGFMENLALDTYLISYLGQFDVSEDYIDAVLLYSNCSSGLVLNMTCQSGDFIISLTQDFESDVYIKALRREFEIENIPVDVSEEILFETPYDSLSEIITEQETKAEKVNKVIGKMAEAARKSTQLAKEKEAAAHALSHSLALVYYDHETGELVKKDVNSPEKQVASDVQDIIKNTPSLFMK